MELERFDPQAAAGPVEACHDIHVAAVRADNPRWPPMSLPVFRSWLTYGWTEDPGEAWLARDRAGQPCGWYLLILPERENRHMAQITPVVHPGRRRAGLGTALLAHGAGRARAVGRTVLTAQTDDVSSPGAAFARAFGARERLSEVLRILRLNRADAGAWAGLRAQAEAAAAGYSLVTWTGPTAPGLHDGVAALFDAANDAPRDTGEQPQFWDAGRVRVCDERVMAQGLRHYTVAARREPGGELAAITQLAVDPLVEPGWGFQELTVVARAHRGHRLGLLVKLAMLDLLATREPQLERIVTGNAGSNQHMIAINEALGFEVADRELSWELGTDAALARAAAATAGRLSPAQG